jgi:pimeloyl-ACP methyl ester carboxylesterase
MTLGRKMLIIFALVLVGLVALVQWRAHQREVSVNAAYPPIGQLLEVDGVTVHAKVQGSGPDLVLIHGASGNMRDFTLDIVDKLTSRYRVILFDRPGLGWTDDLPQHGGAWNNSAASPQEQAALLQKAADQLGVTNPIVLGHSYGGAVALAWGLARPDQTSAIVLVSAVSEVWPGDLGWQYKLTGSTLGSGILIPMITAFLPEKFVETSIASIFAPQPAPEGYSSHIGSDLALRRASMRANAQQVNSLLPHVKRMVPQYDRLTMPVEVVHGSADTIVPMTIHAQVLMTQLPDANLTTLPGIGHMPQHVASDAVLDAIDRATLRAGLR